MLILPAFLSRPYLTLERNGSFDVVARDVSCKCGPEGANTLSYTVRIRCRDKLDRSGFLIDHNDLHAWMVRTYSRVDVFMSCERIAQDAALGLWHLCRTHGCSPVGLTITVAAFGQAGVTATLGRPVPPNA